MSNEIAILKEFVIEFSPFYTSKMVENMDYQELISVIKEIANNL